MTTRTAKGKKDSSTFLDTIIKLLQKHRKEASEEFLRFRKESSKEFQGFRKESSKEFQQLGSEIKQLSTKLNSIQETLTEHDKRIKENEEVLSILDEKMDDLQERYEKQSKDNDELRQKITDVENRSRRNKVRILGLEELTKGDHPTEFFANFLVRLFPHILKSAPMINQAHRVPGNRTFASKPRSVIICFHEFQTKDRIIRESCRKGMIDYNGKKIRIVEDFSAEIMTEHAKFKSVMLELDNKDFKPWYPVKLRITLQDGLPKWFRSSLQAQKFLENAGNTQHDKQNLWKEKKLKH
ncbi:uncharacterized protein LOC134348337 isoform X2 [Mobula hypostoma]|uniref:uncharacterized protein LOC134348337 isoform X2 n=1 Tax=Mobula hypostoma TaxID=723540 RepID=UPI002FC2EA10